MFHWQFYYDIRKRIWKYDQSKEIQIFFSWEKETIESLKIFKFDIDICHFLRYNLCFIAPVEKAREQRVERNKKSTGNVKKRSTVIWRIDVCKINERNHFAFK